LYNDLYKAWKSEKTSQEPQPLPNDFYRKTDAYLNGLEKENESIDDHTAKGRLTLKEKEVATRLLRELKETRLRKLLALARSGEPISDANLTDEERKLLKEFDESLQAFNQALRVETETAATAPKERAELSVVRFLQDIPEIVGTDLKIYGPYKKEDVGSLPNQNAKALVKQGVAKEIEVKGIPKLAKKWDAQRQQQ
jgi:DNA replication factor GINS